MSPLCTCSCLLFRLTCTWACSAWCYFRFVHMDRIVQCHLHAWCCSRGHPAASLLHGNTIVNLKASLRCPPFEYRPTDASPCGLIALYIATRPAWIMHWHAWHYIFAIRRHRVWAYSWLHKDRLCGGCNRVRAHNNWETPVISSVTVSPYILVAPSSA